MRCTTCQRDRPLVAWHSAKLCQSCVQQLKALIPRIAARLAADEYWWTVDT
jgi:hypothetical protein